MRQLLAAGAAALLLVTLPACTDTGRSPAPTATGPLPTATSPGNSSTTAVIDPGATPSPAPPDEITFSFVPATEDDEEDLVDISFPVLHHPVATVADPINDKIIASIDELVVGFTDAASAAPAAQFALNPHPASRTGTDSAMTCSMTSTPMFAGA